MTKERKLTPAMERVIELMKDGWELAHEGGHLSRVWLQKGGAGRGGPSEEVKMQTFDGLWRRGLVRPQSKDVFERPKRYKLVI